MIGWMAGGIGFGIKPRTISKGSLPDEDSDYSFSASVRGLRDG